jgi:hypothetical protein
VHHRGDWLAYLDKWDKQAQKISDIESRGSAIRVSKSKLKVEGRELVIYAGNVVQRAAINHCLVKLFRSGQSRSQTG